MAISLVSISNELLEQTPLIKLLGYFPEGTKMTEIEVKPDWFTGYLNSKVFEISHPSIPDGVNEVKPMFSAEYDADGNTIQVNFDGWGI